MAHEILIVDDEADIRLMVTGILDDEGFATRSVANSDLALAEIDRVRPSVVILDIWLQNSSLDGMQLLKILQDAHPNLPVIMISGHGTIEMAVKAIHMGAYDFVEKPFKTDRMLLILHRAIEAARLKSENAELRLHAEPHPELVGTSSWASQINQAIQKVAPTGSRVLISGPAGAGKEVVARQLHANSRRAENPFVVMNCATMHPDRFEAELLGLAPGAEGAGSSGRAGILERADGGTLFLDEVADMPLETQGKIVRILQDQSFSRIGGERRIGVDLRTVAATNRELPKLIAEGLFREDFYYRLNVVPLTVPPLRDHREDIPDLCAFFMGRAAGSTGLPARRFSEDAMAVLQAYDWPGNVRQLRNVMDWIMIMAPGDPAEAVRPDQLPAEVGSATPAGMTGQRQTEIMSLALRDAREVFERQYLEAQILRFSGNISRTATFVGMERSALHRKLRLLGISAGDRG